MEENEIVTLYKNKVVGKVYLISAIICLLFIFIILLIAEPGPGASETEKIPMAILFMIFVVVLGKKFWDKNRINKNYLFVKENGNVYSGKVLHIYKYKISKKHYTKLLVEFFDGKEKKIILSKHFPYYIKTNDIDLYKVVTKTIDMNEYDYSYNENKISHIQYQGNGYISFEETPLTKTIIKYNGSKNKNYEGDLSCKVYEKDGKYIVDDIDGFSRKEKTKANKLAAKIMLIFILLLFTIMFVGFMQIK